MRTKLVLAVVLCLLSIAPSSVRAAARPPATAAARQVTPPPPAPVPAVPVLSADTHWLRWTLIVVGGLFVAALLIGPLIRTTLPDDIPETHSHDEPPGSSHHHGPGGTVDLVMPDRGHP